MIAEFLQAKLAAYMAGSLNNLQCSACQIGGTEDHVPVLFLLGRTVAMSKAIEELKKNSSKWMKTKGVPQFAWQNGYGAYSVSESAVENGVQYIRDQKEHHRKRDFQSELRDLLLQAGVSYDEKYLWN